MPYNDIIFDLDGTLIDSKDAFIISLREAVLKFAPAKLSSINVDTAFGKSVDGVLKSLSKENIPGIKEYWEELFNKTVANSPIFDGIPKVIETLFSTGKRIFILTSRSLITLEPVLRDSTFYGKITGYSSADDTDKQKPAPDPLLKLIDYWECSPSQCLYIGDTEIDQLCAKDAGIDFALASWGASDNAIPCKYKLESPIDLLILL